MNDTNYEHGAFAVIFMILILGICGLFVNISTSVIIFSALLPLAFFLGREHAQYEYKLVRERKLNSVNELSAFEGFAIWNWNLDSLLDFIFPLVANSFIAAILIFSI